MSRVAAAEILDALLCVRGREHQREATAGERDPHSRAPMDSSTDRDWNLPKWLEALTDPKGLNTSQSTQPRIVAIRRICSPSDSDSP
jgi:hypothetical protein